MADDDGMRGTGRTTKQMLAAPPGAVFIWCNGVLSYPRRMAEKLNRTDLRIYSPHVFEDGAYQLVGMDIPALVIDHAAELTAEQWRGLNRVQAYVGRRTA